MVKKPQIIFLFLSCIFGFLFLIILPPFQAPDEMAHFFRSYQVSEGNFFAKRMNDNVGGALPIELWHPLTPYAKLEGDPTQKVAISCSEFRELLRTPFDKQERYFASFPNTAAYNPIVYIPQALGILAGNFFNGSALWLMYLGRIFNLIFWILLIFLAIKTTPIFKWVFLLLALTPMSLHQAVSLSADAAINGLAFLFTAVCLRFAYDENKVVNFKHALAIILLALAVTISKQVYLPLIFLVLLIPSNKFSSKKSFFLFIALVALISVTGTLIWSHLIRDLMVPLESLIDHHEQTKYILGNPIKFFTILWTTYKMYGLFFLDQIIGKLGWLDTALPIELIFLVAVTLILCALFDKRAAVFLPIKDKLIILSSLFLGVILISTALYILCNAVGKNIVDGIQGRYFIPLTPLLLLLFYNQLKFFPEKPRLLGWTASTSSIISLTWTILVLLKRYYVQS